MGGPPKQAGVAYSDGQLHRSPIPGGVHVRKRALRRGRRSRRREEKVGHGKAINFHTDVRDQTL